MRLLSIMTLLAFLLSCGESEKKEAPISYPFTKKVDQVDDYHGQQIEDPYRWLENDTSNETEEWVKSQNSLTFAYLENIPFRDTIRKRLDDLVNYPRRSAPTKAGSYYFYTRNNGLQNQDVIYRSDGLNGEETVFIDPNKFSEDGTVTFRIADISDDDQYIVLSKSSAGSDWRELIVYDVKSAEPIGDTLKWVKFSGTSWFKEGFYYSRYPTPEEGMDYSSQNSNHSVYYHALGSPQEEDELIYQDKEHPGRYHWSSVSEDKKYLFLYVAEGTDGFECHYKSLENKAEAFTPLFTGFEHKSSVIDHIDGSFLVRTDIDAPKYRLISIPVSAAESSNWIDIIPEGDHLLKSAGTAGGFLFGTYLENAQSKIYRYALDGSNKVSMDLPEAVSAWGFGGKKEDTLLFYGYSSFITPGNIYTYNTKTNESSLFYQSQISFNSDDYESEQVRYTSSDEKEVTMFLVHKKGLEMTGKNPCLLYGYGGFNISLSPSFKTSLIPWLENGGIYAMPNLRGGGEYGESWHQEGMLLNKQQVFDDFIAAAEYLIANGYTSSEKLVISGRSNGGLLVGAVMTQRPDLMKVALPGVGVMDMLRFHKFTVGHGWVPEYGSSDEAEHFKNLVSYSPLHNLKPNTDYPAALIYTGDHDDRVVPAHSFKFAATLQEMNSGKNPTLIRIETNAGHGSGKPISKLMDEEADKLSFSFFNIGHAPYTN